MRKYTQVIIDKFFYEVPASQLPHLTESYRITNNSQIVFTTFKAFIQEDLFCNNMYSAMFIETSNFVRAVRDGFGDYITDTYLRRAYIEALRLQDCYREIDKLNKVNNISATMLKRYDEPP